MLTAVRRDDEPMSDAGEIDDERPDGTPPAKLVSLQRAIAQQRPESAFDVSHLDA